MRLSRLISMSAALAVAGIAVATASQVQAQSPPSQPPAADAPKRTPMPGEGSSKGRPPGPESKKDEKSPPGTQGNSAPQTKPGQAQGKTKQVPAIAVIQPRTPAEREKALNDLYAILATAENEAAAKTVATNIERLWLNSGSDTVSLLMERAATAVQQKKPELALKVLDEVVALAPDYAEGWNRRAYVHFTQNQVQQALGDIRRVLALDPNHFKALDGLVHVLKEIGQKKGALAAVKKLLEVHPYWEGAQAIHDELAREVEGQAL